MSSTESNQEVVLSVENVSKDFHLPHERNDSLKTKIVQAFKPKDKDIDTQHALRDISFDIKKGEFFGILGRNGSGKSTLLKILAEIYQPTSGKVSHKGKLVPFIELGVGFNPELTGRENVYLNGALLGFSRKEIEEKYDEIVAFAELEEFMDQKLKNYSSGMQVRLAFSVATRADADILLVDEVLAVGDADFQRKCYDFFKSLKKSGKTVIFVTHDMGAVREYCDRVVLIKDGLVAHEGGADAIADEYLKLFVSSDESDVSDQKVEEANRWGSRDITFEDVRFGFDKDKLTFNFNIKNNRDIDFADSVDIGIDFYLDDQLVTGTHYLYYNKDGFALRAHEQKSIVVEFPNSFSNYTYDVGINIKTSGGKNVCDEWKNAIKFVNSYKYSKFFKVILDPVRFEEEKS